MAGYHYPFISGKEKFFCFISDFFLFYRHEKDEMSYFQWDMSQRLKKWIADGSVANLDGLISLEHEHLLKLYIN